MRRFAVLLALAGVLAYAGTMLKGEYQSEITQPIRTIQLTDIQKGDTLLIAENQVINIGTRVLSEGLTWKIANSSDGPDKAPVAIMVKTPSSTDAGHEDRQLNAPSSSVLKLKGREWKNRDESNTSANLKLIDAKGAEVKSIDIELFNAPDEGTVQVRNVDEKTKSRFGEKPLEPDGTSVLYVGEKARLKIEGKMDQNEEEARVLARWETSDPKVMAFETVEPKKPVTAEGPVQGHRLVGLTALAKGKTDIKVFYYTRKGSSNAEESKAFKLIVKESPAKFGAISWPNKSASTLRMKLGESIDLTAPVLDKSGDPVEDAEVIVSDPKNLIKRTGLNLKADKPGATTLGLSVKGFDDIKQTLDVEVLKEAEKLELQGPSTLLVDESERYTVVVKDSQGTQIDFAGRALTLTPDDQTTLEVRKDPDQPQSWLIRGLKPGSAELIVRAEDKEERFPIRVVTVGGFEPVQVALDIMDETTAGYLFGKKTSDQFYVMRVRLFNNLDNLADRALIGSSILAYSESIEVGVELDKIFDPKSKVKVDNPTSHWTKIEPEEFVREFTRAHENPDNNVAGRSELHGKLLPRAYFKGLPNVRILSTPSELEFMQVGDRIGLVFEDQYGSKVTSGITWSVVNGSGVLGLNAETGVVTANSIGDAEVIGTQKATGLTSRTLILVYGSPEKSVVQEPVRLVKVRKGHRIRLTLTNCTGSVTWASGDVTKVSIDPATGIATGLETGESLITAQIGGKDYYYAQVRVTANEIESVDLSDLPTQRVLGVGDSILARAPVRSREEVKWESGNRDIADVRDGLITAKRPGVVLIYAKTRAPLNEIQTLSVSGKIAFSLKLGDKSTTASGLDQSSTADAIQAALNKALGDGAVRVTGGNGRFDIEFVDSDYAGKDQEFLCVIDGTNQDEHAKIEEKQKGGSGAKTDKTFVLALQIDDEGFLGELPPSVFQEDGRVLQMRHRFRYRPYSYDIMLNTIGPRDLGTSRSRALDLFAGLRSIMSFALPFERNPSESKLNLFSSGIGGVLLPGFEAIWRDMSPTQRQNFVQMTMRHIEEIPFGGDLERVLFFPKSAFRGALRGHFVRISEIDTSYFYVKVAIVNKRASQTVRSGAPTAGGGNPPPN